MVKGYQGPPDRLARYEELVAAHGDVTLKGATMPYTSLNGHMFSFIDASGTVALRLPSDQRERFLELYESTLAEQYGRQMQEFVVVPAELLDRADELAEWFERSHEWVGSLDPNPTKRG